ncbi:unnamed protein product [Owenia fusiformis]|uniref:Chitin-binding type-2 domain-containing protein n=1 Tax=Owenia fusiformis TaxID=6347 RepID=A0A8S4PAU9_OWEFU|nr:unnamed protein product [Owenia fusiformis]
MPIWFPFLIFLDFSVRRMHVFAAQAAPCTTTSTIREFIADDADPCFYFECIYAGLTTGIRRSCAPGSGVPRGFKSTENPCRLFNPNCRLSTENTQSSLLMPPGVIQGTGTSNTFQQSASNTWQQGSPPQGSWQPAQPTMQWRMVPSPPAWVQNPGPPACTPRTIHTRWPVPVPVPVPCGDTTVQPDTTTTSSTFPPGTTPGTPPGTVIKILCRT